jgi:O-antigen/teichoic acid export membrane protein
LDFAGAIPLLKVGFPIMLIGLADVILRSVDKLMILGMMTPTDLGYYGLAIAISSSIYFIPSVVGQVIYPRFLERYGETGNPKKLKGYLTKSMLALAYIVPMVTCFIFLTVYLLIAYILPKYEPGLLAAKIVVLSTFFLSVATIATLFLITMGKQMKVIPLQIIAILASASIDYFVIKAGFGITGVAFATAFAFFLFCSFVIAYAFRHVSHSIRELGVIFFEAYLPFAYTAVAVFALDWLMPESFGIKGVALTAAKVVAFYLLAAPLFFMMNKKTGLVDTILEILRAKFRS